MTHASLRRRSYALTDVGRRRPQNEDAFVADDTLGLYVVADGVGGHAKGEVASAESVEQVRNFVCSGQRVIDAFLQTGEDHTGRARLTLRRLLESAVQSACYFVYGLAEQDPAGTGMSTTLSALLLCGGHAVIGQVGDSRVYHSRDGKTTQVTVDHTLINHQIAHGLITPGEAASARGKNVITRAVGHRDYVEVDIFQMEICGGDRFLICSDGLHGYLDPRELDHLLENGTVESVARRAIELANDRGGKDNITAVVIAVS